MMVMAAADARASLHAKNETATLKPGRGDLALMIFFASKRGALMQAAIEVSPSGQ